MQKRKVFPWKFNASEKLDKSGFLKKLTVKLDVGKLYVGKTSIKYWQETW